jgi:hypothetical protein
MPIQSIERTFPGSQGRDLFAEVRHELRTYVERFSLSEEADPAAKKLRVWRLGFEGKLQVVGPTVKIALDYSRLIPGVLRQRITDGVTAALEKLGAPGSEEQ